MRPRRVLDARISYLTADGYGPAFRERVRAQLREYLRKDGVAVPRIVARSVAGGDERAVLTDESSRLWQDHLAEHEILHAKVDRASHDGGQVETEFGIPVRRHAAKAVVFAALILTGHAHRVEVEIPAAQGIVVRIDLRQDRFGDIEAVDELFTARETLQLVHPLLHFREIRRREPRFDGAVQQLAVGARDELQKIIECHESAPEYLVGARPQYAVGGAAGALFLRDERVRDLRPAHDSGRGAPTVVVLHLAGVQAGGERLVDGVGRQRLVLPRPHDELSINPHAYAVVGRRVEAVGAAAREVPVAFP